MKRAMVLILAMGIMVALLAVTGCGEEKTTVKTPEGEVTATEDGGEVKIETEEGEITYGTGDEPPEAELGAPVYPGAEYLEGSSGSYSEEGGVTEAIAASYTTGDSYGDVVDWYKDELGRPTYEGTGGYEGTSWQFTEGGYMVSVNVTTDNGDVLITITKIVSEGME